MLINFPFMVYFQDPREWTEEHVIYWLNWAIKEFSLVSMNLEPFIKMKGRDMIELGKDKFLAITPPFTGDILWEHLDILQKGKWKGVWSIKVIERMNIK